MKLYDQLYGETDDACAICGKRGPDELTVHHIDHDDSNNSYDNMIVLCKNCHQVEYHQKTVLSKSQIEDRKRHLIEKTLTRLGLNAMKIADRNDFGVVAMPFILYHLVDLGYMTKEEDQMGYGGQHDATSRFAITAEGKKLLSKWFSKG